MGTFEDLKRGESKAGSSIYDKLRLKHTKTIEWPGTDVQVTIRPVTDEDIQSAIIETEKLYAQAGVKIELYNIAEFEAAKDSALLYKIITDPHAKKPVAPNIQAFRGLLTLDAKAALTDEIHGFTEEAVPIKKDYSEELPELIEKVKLNPDHINQITSTHLLRQIVSSVVGETIQKEKQENKGDE